MARDDWFRHSTWTAADKEEFFARLKRSRSSSNKAQYVRIQADHLACAGQFASALELLDLLFREFPERLELAQAHLQKAECFVKLEDRAAAISEFRLSLECQRNCPNVGTNCWLHYPWYIVRQEMADFYDEALAILEEFNEPHRLILPWDWYQFATVRALIAASRGEMTQAREFARIAVDAAAARHSGFRYHPDVGLVEKLDSVVHDRLIALIAD